MATFLQKTASHLWSKHQADEMQEIAIVMPSQRGVLYLKKELAYLSDRPFLSPDFMTIEEFALQMTDSVLVDPVKLLLDAFTCFKEVDPLVDFDRFVSWGQMMLKDFDTLDMYLVDPVQLFSFLSEVKSIERWGENLGDQESYQFITKNTTAYFKLYDHLLEVYGRLQTKLQDSGLVYRGMAYKALAERLQAGTPLSKSFKKIYFVGFNALSKGEEQIIRLLVKQNMAETLWDADAYYIENKYHRAGNWIRSFADAGSNSFLSHGPFQWMGRDLLESTKHVELIGVANPSAQVFVAMDTIRKWQEAHGPGEQVALVLADESLLDQVLLYVGEFKDRLNITMGYSLKKTAIFSWLQLFWEVRKSLSTGKFPVALVKQVLDHPLMVTYFNHQKTKIPADFILSTDLYISKERLNDLGLPLINKMLVEANFMDLLPALASILNDFLLAIPKQEFDQEAQAIHSVLGVLETVGQTFSGNDFITPKSGQLLLTQLIQQQKLTFEGAEKRSLHVMGLLETRTLDFDRVLFLSLNEGSLPGSRKRESLIPLDIASMNTFDLPTFTQADAVASYHFHRLLQRPREIHFMYVLPSEKSSVKEMSRFIRQLEFDWVKKNPNIHWHEPMIQLNEPVGILQNIEHSVIKTPDIIAQLHANFSLRGLSPSSLAMFDRCSLQYYYAQIAGLRKEKQHEEEMGADVFGTWVHKVLELMDRDVLDKHDGYYDQTTVDVRIAALDDYLDAAMAEIQRTEGVFEVEKGFNYVLREVAKTILTRYFQEEVSWERARVQLIAIEETLETQLSVHDLALKIKGRVDRLDRLGVNTYRIIDYKTGKVEQKDLAIGEEGLFYELTKEGFKPKLFQLWFYKFLLASVCQDSSDTYADLMGKIDRANIIITSGIISFRNMDAAVISEDEHNLWFEPGQDLDGFLAMGKAVFAAWVDRIVDVGKPFEKTKDVETCQWCDFKVICHREI